MATITDQVVYYPANWPDDHAGKFYELSTGIQVWPDPNSIYFTDIDPTTTVTTPTTDTSDDSTSTAGNA